MTRRAMWKAARDAALVCVCATAVIIPSQMARYSPSRPQAVSYGPLVSLYDAVHDDPPQGGPLDPFVPEMTATGSTTPTSNWGLPRPSGRA
jgi:hypothetical protein